MRSDEARAPGNQIPQAESLAFRYGWSVLVNGPAVDGVGSTPAAGSTICRVCDLCKRRPGAPPLKFPAECADEVTHSLLANASGRCGRRWRQSARTRSEEGEVAPKSVCRGRSGFSVGRGPRACVARVASALLPKEMHRDGDRSVPVAPPA